MAHAAMQPCSTICRAPLRCAWLFLVWPESLLTLLRAARRCPSARTCLPPGAARHVLLLPVERKPYFGGFVPGAGARCQAGGRLAGGHGGPVPAARARGTARATPRGHIGRAGVRGGRHQLRQEGGAQGLQDDGRPEQGHRQERALLAPRRERALRHLRRHVPRQLPARRGHHPAGRRGRQLLRYRPGRSRGDGVFQVSSAVFRGWISLSESVCSARTPIKLVAGGTDLSAVGRFCRCTSTTSR